MDATHAFEAQGTGIFSPTLQSVYVGNITEDGVDGLDSGGFRSVDQTRASVERLVAFRCAGHSQISGVVFEADGECYYVVGRGRDGSGVLDSLRRFENGHQPDRAIDLVADLEFADHVVDLGDLAGVLDLGNQDQVGGLRNNLGQVFEAKRKLVNAHHALAGAEIDGAQRIANEDASGIFFGVVHRIFQVEDDRVGTVQRGVDRVLGFGAREIQTRAAQTVFGRRIGQCDS